MITCPDDWVDRSSAGGLILLPRDEELPGCVLRYQERVVPQRSLWSLVRECLGFDAGLSVTQVGQVQCFHTEEGEYAALVRVDGVHGAQPIAHLIGAIFAEDFSTLLDARVRDVSRLEQYGRLVYDLITQDRLSLGVRRRRVLFMPPPEWNAVGRGLATALYPPEYPRSLSCIVVSPAEPIGSGAVDLNQELQRQDEQRGLVRPSGQEDSLMTLVTPHGLGGQLWRTLRIAAGGVQVARDLAVLSDNTYLYSVRLDATPHDKLPLHRQIFLDLVNSIRRIQLPTSTSRAGVGPSPLDSPYKFWDD